MVEAMFGDQGSEGLSEIGRDWHNTFPAPLAAQKHLGPGPVELDIVDIAGGSVPFADVAVYVWHCTREGEYSMYSASVADENFLRGVQVAGADGKVAFTSIFPACYSGRWPHIHFVV